MHADADFADAKARLSTLQLTRLERVTDVLYAIVLWRAFMLLPRPGEGGWAWDNVPDFVRDNLMTFALMGVGVAVTIIYWVQNNALNGKLKRTDVRHTAISLAQLFLLLMFLYSLRLGVVLGSSVGTRVFESLTAAMMGVMSSIGFTYAIRNRRLLHDDVPESEAVALSNRILAEPITAVITVPFAFAGALYWEAAWLSYLLVVMVVRLRRRSLPS